MIVIEQKALADLSLKVIEPFLKMWGTISPQQHPVFSTMLHDVRRMMVFFFYKENKLIGFVIVQTNRNIFADIFHGPVVLHRDHYPDCVKLLKNQLRKKGIVAVRVFPPHYGQCISGLISHFQWATTVVNLLRTPDQIFAGFNTNHRYGIRKAIKKEVEVIELSSDDVDYYCEGHSKIYKIRGLKVSNEKLVMLREMFLEILRLGKDFGYVLGIKDKATNELIAGGIFLRIGDTVIYINGYSMRINKLSLSHLLQWHSMKMAHQFGCKHFDLHGYSLKDNKQLLAINNFKRWFGSEVIIYPQTSVIGLIPGVILVSRLLNKKL